MEDATHNNSSTDRLLHVDLQHPRVFAYPPGNPIKSGVRAFALPAGIAVKHESSFEPRFDDLNQRLVHDTITERGRTNGARLRIGDRKHAVGPGLPSATLQFAFEPQALVLGALQEPRRRAAVTLAAGGDAGSAEKVAEVRDLCEQILVGHVQDCGGRGSRTDSRTSFGQAIGCRVAASTY